MRRINRWITDHGMELALAKTDLIPMTVGTEVTQTKNEAKYLGMTLERK